MKRLIERTNRERPTCPVGLYTLVFPHHSEESSMASVGEIPEEKQQPYAYLSCGHVQGEHAWGLNKDSNNRTCPMCLKVIRCFKSVCNFLLFYSTQLKIFRLVELPN